jgi:hypothetical protein
LELIGSNTSTKLREMRSRSVDSSKLRGKLLPVERVVEGRVGREDEGVAMLGTRMMMLLSIPRLFGIQRWVGVKSSSQAHVLCMI